MYIYYIISCIPEYKTTKREDHQQMFYFTGQPHLPCCLLLDKIVFVVVVLFFILIQQIVSYYYSFIVLLCKVVT